MVGGSTDKFLGLLTIRVVPLLRHSRSLMSSGEEGVLSLGQLRSIQSGAP